MLNINFCNDIHKGERRWYNEYVADSKNSKGGLMKDEYDDIYGDEELDLDDEEIDPDDAVELLRGKITSGDCIYCGGTNSMIFDEVCFICTICNRSIHEDLYYRWAAGYEIEMDDDYDDIF